METPQDPEPAPAPAPAPAVVFRSSKKRKANLRQRAPDDDDNSLQEPQPPPSTVSPESHQTPQTVDELIATAAQAGSPPPVAEPSVAEALRLRAQRRAHRLNGVGFTSSGRDDASPNTERGLVPHAPPDDGHQQPVGGMTNRFAPQTGLNTQLVNKHMMEYIESKLSSSRPSPSASESPKPDAQQPATATTTPTTATAAKAAAVPAVASATRQGKLMEIDLGEEARARNIALTERARRRLLGDADDAASPSGSDADPDPSRPSKKPRLDRHGRPWRPRNRRGSQDAARDRLVEEVLHESRRKFCLYLPLLAFPGNPANVSPPPAVDVYEPLPDETPAAAAEDDDTTADDRLADEFRREFLDAVALRRQQHAATVAQRKRNAILAGGTGTRKGPEDDVLRGPKLGGSRSQRSAMRDILLAKEKEKLKLQRKR